MLILEKPNFPPYVCITCGTGTGRKWFVSLDFPLDNYFNPLHDGIVFQCNECWESLATQVAKLAQTYLLGQEPWDSREYVEPQYENKAELVKEVNFGPGQTSGSTDNDSGSPEPSNPESNTSEQPTDDATDDAESEPLSEFRGFFGEPTG